MVMIGVEARQIYASCRDPEKKIRVAAVLGPDRVLVEDWPYPDKQRELPTRLLHLTAVTKEGKPRTSGYYLIEQPAA